MNEQTPYCLDEQKAGDYDRSKAQAEQAVIAARSEQLKTTIFNPTAVLGPFDFKPGFTGQLVWDLCHGKIPMLTPRGYDWVDVRDVADAIVTALERNVANEKFILSGEYAPVAEVAALAAIYSGRPAPKITVPFWLARIGVPFVALQSKITGQVPLYTADSLKAIEEGCRNVSCLRAKQQLDYKTRQLDESVKDTIAWFREQQLIK